MAQEVVENLLNPIILPSRCLRELEVIGEECKKKNDNEKKVRSATKGKQDYTNYIGKRKEI